jgi:hypothetical protein
VILSADGCTYGTSCKYIHQKHYVCLSILMSLYVYWYLEQKVGVLVCVHT